MYTVPPTMHDTATTGISSFKPQRHTASCQLKLTVIHTTIQDTVRTTLVCRDLASFTRWSPQS